ncbi:2-C-methyl-D-erythritol 4-phosphate cytidylyltransferase [Bacillus sp. 2205SS5-2]|uniref:2-C-methyl-D-erythritol 4-phosphate cytidylyltransferase n=1 Tax=Bacillus sp. 2205SS5-2 TaxID=3109031 RepID=UPI0030060AAE
MTYQVVIPAAGKGKRMGANRNKLLLEIHQTPIIVHTLKVFEQDPLCDGTFLVIHPDEEEIFQELMKQFDLQKVRQLVYGGSERQYSVFNGIKALNHDGVVLVHDGARPFITTDVIHALVIAAEKEGAAIAAVPVKDTIKKVHQHTVIETIDRSSLWSIQTPQAFRFSLLEKAHREAVAHSFLGTDDASLVERMGQRVAIVESDYDNIKLTTTEDLYFADAILQKRSERTSN